MGMGSMTLLCKEYYLFKFRTALNQCYHSRFDRIVFWHSPADLLPDARETVQPLPSQNYIRETRPQYSTVKVRLKWAPVIE